MTSEEFQDSSPDLTAAEYVLGTLDRDEREAAQALLASDPAFAALIAQWERRLGELHALAGAVDPPASVWEAIKAKLPETAASVTLRLPELPPPLPELPRPLPAGVIDLTTRLARWRGIAAVAGTMAAVFAVLFVASAVAPTLLPDALRPRPRVIVQVTEAPAPTPPRYVAVLQRDASAPAFIVTVDIAKRGLTVRRVSAEREAGKSYELWLVSNKLPAPKSLGLVGGGEFTQSEGLSSYDPATISEATFAVSLEPEGGSPTGAPSNVMFQGKLVEFEPAFGEPTGRKVKGGLAMQPCRRGPCCRLSNPGEPRHRGRETPPAPAKKCARKGRMSLRLGTWGWKLGVGNLGLETCNLGNKVTRVRGQRAQGRLDQRTSEVPLLVTAIGLPALIGGPDACMCEVSVDAIWVVIPTTMTAIEATSDSTTTLRWVARSAVKIVELFIGTPLRVYTYLVRRSGLEVQTYLTAR